jgi:hypothetical protein
LNSGQPKFLKTPFSASVSIDCAILRFVVTNPSPAHLIEAFPTVIRDVALAAISTLPEAPTPSQGFSVNIGSETVTIPYRIYHDPESIHADRLTQTQVEVLSCLLTRHSSGFVREQHLRRILNSRHEWVPPFVIQLVGEYVVEIVDVIRENIDHLNPSLYGAFLTSNPAFYQLTKQRVISYWNCYYRGQQKTDYAGFQVLAALDRLI